MHHQFKPTKKKRRDHLNREEIEEKGKKSILENVSAMNWNWIGEMIDRFFFLSSSSLLLLLFVIIIVISKKRHEYLMCIVPFGFSFFSFFRLSTKRYRCCCCRYVMMFDHLEMLTNIYFAHAFSFFRRKKTIKNIFRFSDLIRIFIKFFTWWIYQVN